MAQKQMSNQHEVKRCRAIAKLRRANWERSGPVMSERRQLLEEICPSPRNGSAAPLSCAKSVWTTRCGSKVELLQASADYAEVLFLCRRQSSRAPTMVPARSLPGRRPARRSGRQKLRTSDSDRNHDLSPAAFDMR